MKQPILERLQKDHQQMQALLNIIERQCKAIAAGDRPDYRLMYQVMHYLTYYPDRYHHVFEDLLFDRLRARTDSQQTVIDRLFRQHADIATQGVELRMHIEAVLNDLPQPRAAFARMGADYVATYREHLEVEERQIFPALVQYLQPFDWLSVLTRFEWQTDPLFTAEVAREYQSLAGILQTMGVDIGSLPDAYLHGCPACSEHERTL